MLVRHSRASSSVPPLLGGPDWDADHTVIAPLSPLPGQYYHAGLTAAINGTLALSANRLYLMPMPRVPRAVTIDRLGIQITTGIAGATIRVALYDQVPENGINGEAGWPGAPLNLSPDMAADTNNAQAEFTLSRALDPRRQYWTAIWASAGVAVRALATTNAPLLLSNGANGFTGIASLWVSRTYAGNTWPDPAGLNPAALASAAVAAQNQSVPCVTWRIAA